MANLTKDQRILKDNPKATPHELLLKGLSQAKYEELVQKAENDVKAPIQKEPVKTEPIVQQVQVMNKQAPVIRAIPKTDSAAPIFTSSHDMAWLIDKTGRCRPFWCTYTYAMKQVKKYPKQFEIRQ